jgi:hypothetical protein
MGFINSPWTIGIVTGLLVWLITFMVSRMLLSKRENREYAQKLASANREVIVAIRPGIAEGSVPSPEIVEAIINSTARRYSVTPTDMYTSKEISEELIKEVMDSSFLSSVQKTEYCSKLVPARPLSASLTLTVTEADEAGKKPRGASALYRERMVMMMSLMLSISAAFMTVFLAIPELRKTLSLGGDADRLSWTVLVPTLVTLSMVIVVFFTRELRSHSRETIEDATKKVEAISDKIKLALKKK